MTNFTTASTGGGTLTVETIRAAIERVKTLMADLPPAAPRIIMSDTALLYHQARVYPKRKAKNASHQRRMNNKWLRRYGKIGKPAAFQMCSALTGDEPIVVMHPSLASRLDDRITGLQK